MNTKLLLAIVFTALGMSAACKRGESEKTAEQKADSIKAAKKDTSTSVITPGDNGPIPFDPQRPYAVETGIVEYKFTGDRTGTQVIHFKDFGRTQRLESRYTNENSVSKRPVNQVYISTPDKVYFYDYTTKIGYWRKAGDATAEQNIKDDIIRIGIDSTMAKNGYARQGSRVISGNKCQVFKAGESEFCFYEGMNVRTQMKLAGDQYTLEATSFKKGAKVEESLFTPPADVKILPYAEYQKKFKDEL